MLRSRAQIPLARLSAKDFQQKVRRDLKRAAMLRSRAQIPLARLFAKDFQQEIMFSDTHFHLQHTFERGINIAVDLDTMATRNCFFALDIGTHCDDLESRRLVALEVINNIPDSTNRTKAKEMLFFSAGIWPAAEAINQRHQQIKQLEAIVQEALNKGIDGFGKKLCAIGECGLDHHWNPSGVDNRNQEDFQSISMINAEAEMFEMQLELAKKMNLPIIVHSRDAFDGTLSCIKNIDYNRGVIHCYSYGKEEARCFLNRGWHISFSGSVTYAKKSKLPDMLELLRFVPQDRLLLETDAPYLAPVPYRGQTNSPLFVEHIYSFVAQALNLTREQLCSLVDGNIANLFCL